MATQQSVTGTELIDDHAAIAVPLQLYIDGSARGDEEMLTEAFHPTARVYGALAGTRYDMPVAEWRAIVVDAPADSHGTYRGRILSIEQVGDIALGVVAEDGYWGTMSFVAQFSVAHIEGRWQIVNKMFTHTHGEPPA